MITLCLIGYLLVGFFSAGIIWEITDLKYDPISDLLFVFIIMGWPLCFTVMTGRALGLKIAPIFFWLARSPVFAVRRLKTWRTKKKKLPVARIIKKVKS